MLRQEQRQLGATCLKIPSTLVVFSFLLPALKARMSLFLSLSLFLCEFSVFPADC